MSGLRDIDRSPWLSLLAEASDGVVVAAPQPWRVVYANTTFASRLGSLPDDLCGRSIGEFFGPEAGRELIELLDDVLWEAAPSASVAVERIPVLASTRPSRIYLHRVPIGGQECVVMLVRDVVVESGNPADASAIRRDPLTGLADRSVLMARLGVLGGGGRSPVQPFAVLFIDLDNFKQVNDAQGHLAGDRVLVEVARRLASCVRTRDLVARYGGDEFVALVERVSGWQQIEPVVRRIRAALDLPIVLDEGEVTLSVSIGVAEASANLQSPEDLLHEADRAMYASKRAGI